MHWGKIQAEPDKIVKKLVTKTLTSHLFVPTKARFCAWRKNEGFAKECAVVTHYRLKLTQNNCPSIRSDKFQRRRTDCSPHLKHYLEHRQSLIQSYRDLQQFSSINGKCCLLGNENQNSFLRTLNFFGKKVTLHTQLKMKLIEENGKNVRSVCRCSRKFP